MPLEANRSSSAASLALLCCAALTVSACGADKGADKTQAEGAAKSPTPPDTKPAADAKSPTAAAGAPAPTGALIASFAGGARYGFEKRGDAWIFYDASAPAPAEHTPEMTVQHLCDQRQSEGLVSEDGIFLVVDGVEIKDGATVTVSLDVTYEDAGTSAKTRGAITLSDKGTLVCSHEDNR